MSKTIRKGCLALILALGLMIPAAVMAETTPESTENEQAQQASFEQADAYYQRSAMAPGWAVMSYTVSGALIGGAIGLGAWLLTGMDWSPWTIAQFAGGGAVIGAGVGLVRVLTMDDTVVASKVLERPDSVKFVKQEVGKSFEVPVLRLTF